MTTGMTEQEADYLEQAMRDFLEASRLGLFHIGRVPVGMIVDDSGEMVSSGTFISGPLSSIFPVRTPREGLVFRITLGFAPIEIGSKEQWRKVQEWLALFGPMVMGEEI